ncbi:hypothetical protein GIW32_04735 [Pseudomonas syringae]|nr:hypothetical protein [Pseudomonas syringae]MCF5241167.1 hypothetical protein [Pseudomonas syringae]
MSEAGLALISRRACQTASRRRPPCNEPVFCERRAGLFFDCLHVEIVICQLLLQAPLFKQIVDGASLAQVGLGRFDGRGVGFIGVSDDKVIIYVQLLIVSTHKVDSRAVTLWRLLYRQTTGG